MRIISDNSHSLSPISFWLFFYLSFSQYMDELLIDIPLRTPTHGHASVGAERKCLSLSLSLSHYKTTIFIPAPLFSYTFFISLFFSHFSFFRALYSFLSWYLYILCTLRPSISLTLSLYSTKWAIFHLWKIDIIKVPRVTRPKKLGSKFFFLVKSNYNSFLFSSFKAEEFAKHLRKTFNFEMLLSKFFDTDIFWHKNCI